MRSKSLSFALLSAVTSAERAAAIEGDLLEERRVNGTWWFVQHVLRTTCALFGLALMRAPLRTATLSVAAVATTCLMCALVGRAFFAPQALFPSPLFGFAAVVGSAVLIGVVLVCVAGALGVRAAVATSLLLLLMFVVARATGGLAPAPIGEAGEIGSFNTVGAFALQLVLALCVYPTPLLIASGWAHVRRL